MSIMEMLIQDNGQKAIKRYFRVKVAKKIVHGAWERHARLSLAASAEFQSCKPGSSCRLDIHTRGSLEIGKGRVACHEIYNINIQN